jgi:hypothetical protein
MWLYLLFEDGDLSLNWLPRHQVRFSDFQFSEPPGKSSAENLGALMLFGDFILRFPILITATTSYASKIFWSMPAAQNWFRFKTIIRIRKCISTFSMPGIHDRGKA